MSHPTWVRGLKQCSCLVLNRFIIVAPYVGAWIETEGLAGAHPIIPVAPYVGAWIETYMARSCISLRLVAPYVGAWIETRQTHNERPAGASHPTWVRGLKLIQFARMNTHIKVAPYVGQ